MLASDNPKKGQLGLANLGNTCYLNAALQCLRHVPDLTVFFHKHSETWIHEKVTKESTLCKAYKELVTGLWSQVGPAAMRPAGFVHYFRDALKDCPTYEHMITPQAHDSFEALSFLLDQLHEGMKKPLNINVVAEKTSPTYGALMAWKEQVAPNYSPIVDYFFGLIEVSVTCNGCSKVRCRYDPFNMLKVKFHDTKKSSLEECMDAEFTPDDFEDYQCDDCSPDVPKDSPTPKKKRPSGSVKRRIWRLPQNLIVILKRFEHDGTNPVKRHNDFEADPVQKFSKWFAEKSPESSKSADYSLQSVVDHHGSANGGHYVAQIKSPITGKWNVYDDENVSTMKDGSQVYLGRPSYILFYRKQ